MTRKEAVESYGKELCSLFLMTYELSDLDGAVVVLQDEGYEIDYDSAIEIATAFGVYNE